MIKVSNWVDTVLAEKRPHKKKRITAPWGERVSIDVGIVDLMRLVWATGIETVYSCENCREGLGRISSRSLDVFQIAVSNSEMAERLYFISTGNVIDLRPLVIAKRKLEGMLTYWHRGWEFEIISRDGVIHCFIPLAQREAIARRVAQQSNVV
jgi:hypothetical protein